MKRKYRYRPLYARIFRGIIRGVAGVLAGVLLLAAMLSAVTYVARDAIRGVFEDYQFFSRANVITAGELADIMEGRAEALQRPFILTDSFDSARELFNEYEGEFIVSRRNGILHQADALVGEPIAERILRGHRLLDVSRNVLNRITLLAFAYNMTNESRYAERAVKEMRAVSNFSNWNPSHFLDAAVMSLAVSIGFDWLYDYISESDKQFFADAVFRHGIGPALRTNFGNIWKIYTNNWNGVCYGAIGIACMAFYGYLPPQAARRAAGFLASAFNRMPAGISPFTPDGMYVEGPSYWDFGTSCLVYFVESSNNFFGAEHGSFGLEDTRGFDRVETPCGPRGIAYFPLIVSSPIGSFNFGDNNTRDRRIHSPTLFWWADRYGDPLLKQYQLTSPADGERPEQLVQTFLWYDKDMDTEVAGEAGKLPNAVHLRSDSSQEAVFFRSSYFDNDASFFAAKGGYNYTNHGDLDIGTFVYDWGGVRWAEDLGTGNSSAPGLYDRFIFGRRWRLYEKRAEGHNTLVINPHRRLEDQYVYARASFNGFTTWEGGGSVVLDMTDAYKRNNATGVVRTFTVNDNYHNILIEDRISCRRPSEIFWFWHTFADITIIEGGKAAVLTRGALSIILRIEERSHADAVFTREFENPVSIVGRGSRAATHNADVRRLAIRLDGVREANIRVSVTPVRG
jgi:hypothetical protein